MRNPKFNNGRCRARAIRALLIFNFAFLICHVRADDFGDVTATAGAMYSGNTYHGYAETRVMLENRSAGRTHNIELVTPNRSYNNYGNSLNQVSRTVTLAPGARMAVPLLQPPLPANGDGNIRVVVDGRDEGTLRQPNANNHCNQYYRGNVAATLFISRSLDADEVNRVFNAGRGPFTAAMALGAADSRGHGMQPTSWMPDIRRYGQTNWLELDYDSPQTVSKISVYQTQPPASGGTLSLIGDSGHVIVRLPFSAGATSATGSDWVSDFTLPETTNRVVTVRLDFGKSPPGNIAIDAVEISGADGSAWAANARASSDNSASGPRYLPGAHGSSGSGAEVIQSLRAEAAVNDWSDDWLAYTPFDVIVLGAADVAALPAPVAAAIGNYLQAGGNVVIFGESSVPDAWAAIRSDPVGGGQQFSSGFGRIFMLSDASLAQVSPQTMRTLRETAAVSARYWQMLPGDGDAANAALPVVESLKIPVRGTVIIMLLFIIAIGPLNIFLLSRKKRRTWMLWTIPAISFATTLLVFAYSLVREGVTPNTRIAGLTVLDQAHHHAATAGAAGFYCPLTPGGGLHFEGRTEATPLVPIGYARSGRAQRDVDWSQGQHFQRGWVASRVPAHFHLRKSETRRERLEIQNESGRLQVVNGLGATIQSLWVADADMNFYEATNIVAGQKAPLVLSKDPPASEKTGARGLLRDYSFAPAPPGPDAHAGKYLQPGTYLAVLEGNPFVENALGAAASPKRTRASALVFGILEPVAVK